MKIGGWLANALCDGFYASRRRRVRSSMRSVVWQRTLWQASLIALAGLLVVEFAALNLKREVETRPKVLTGEFQIEDQTLTWTVTPFDLKPGDLDLKSTGPTENGNPVEDQAAPVEFPLIAEITKDVGESEAQAIPAAVSMEPAFQEASKQSFPLALAIALGVWVVGTLVLAGRLLVGRFLLLRFCARSRSVWAHPGTAPGKTGEGDGELGRESKAGRRAPLTPALSPPRGEGGGAWPCFPRVLTIGGSAQMRTPSVYDVRLYDRVQGIAGKLGLKQGVQVLETERIQTPVVFGLVRLTIALPVGFAERFERRQQEAILAHELAHLAARDPLWYLLADALVSVLWWHPLLWVARARLQVTSELAADEACVLAKHGPETLAECLVTIAKEMHGQGALESIGIEGSGFRSRLGQRVERLLNLSADAVARPAVWRTRLVKVGMPVLLMAVLLVGSGWVRRDGGAPWSGLISGAWNMMSGVLRVEEMDIRRDVRPILMAAGPVQVTQDNSQGVVKDGAGEAGALVQIAKKFYVQARYEEAEEKLKEALALAPKNREAMAFFDLVKEIKRQEKNIKQFEDHAEYASALEGRKLSPLTIIPLDPDALVKGLGRLTGWKPEFKNDAGIGDETGAIGRLVITNQNWGEWQQVINETKDFVRTEGASGQWSAFEGGFLSTSAGLKPFFLTLRGKPEDVVTAKRAVDKLHAAAELVQPAKESESGKSTAIGNQRLNEATIKRLEQVKLPELFMDGLPLEITLQFLTEESVKKDPEKKGFKMVARGNVPYVPPPDGRPPLNAAGLPVIPPDAGEHNLNRPLEGLPVLVNPPKKNLNFKQVIEAVCEGALWPLTYQIEDGVIVFTAKPLAKLDAIKLKRDTIKGMPLGGVVGYLNDLSLRFDEGKEGVKFSVEGKFQMENGGEMDAAVTLVSSEIPEGTTLRQALDLICSRADYPLEYEEKATGVVLRPRKGTPRLKALVPSELPDAARKVVHDKLTRVTIPKLDFKQVPLKDALSRLEKQAKEADLEGDGLLIEAGQELTLLLSKQPMMVTIDPAMSNRQLGDAIDTVILAAQNNSTNRLKRNYSDTGISISPMQPSFGLRRVYQVDVTKWIELLEQGAGRKLSLEEKAGGRGNVDKLVKDYLQQQRVRFSRSKEGTELPIVTLDYRLGMVAVTGEREQLEQLEKLFGPARLVAMNGAKGAGTELEPLFSQIFNLRHAVPTNIVPALQAVFTDPRVKIVADNRSQKLLVNALERDMKKVEEVIRELDVAANAVPPGQTTTRLDSAEAAAIRVASLRLLEEIMKRAVACQKEDSLGLAATFYEEALKLVQQVGGNGMEAQKRQALTGLAECRLGFARQLLKDQQFLGATDQAEQLLKHDPENKDAKEIKKQYGGRDNSNATLVPLAGTPKVEKDRIPRLIQDAKLLYELSRWDEAEKNLREVIKADPANTNAFHYLNLIQEARYGGLARKRDAEQRARIVEVEKAWEIPAGTNRLAVPNPYVQTNTIRGKMPLRNVILAKLDQMVIKELYFDGVPLAEVVRFLHEESVRQDPEKKGVRFIINSNPDEQPGSGGRTNSAVVDLEKAMITINPPLKNLRMSDAIDAITKVAAGAGEHGLGFMVEDYAVVFRQRVIDPPQLFTRIWKVDKDKLVQGLEKQAGLKFMPLATNLTVTGATNWLQSVMVTNQGLVVTGNSVTRSREFAHVAQQFFAACGVNMSTNGPGQAPTQIFFNDRTGVLMARATLRDLELIAHGLEAIGAVVDNTPTPSGISAAGSSVVRFYKFDAPAYVRGLEKVTGKKVAEMSAADLAAQVNGGRGTTNKHHVEWHQIELLTREFLMAQGADLSAGNFGLTYPQNPEDVQEVRWNVGGSAMAEEVFQRSGQKILAAGKQDGEVMPLGRATNQVAIKPVAESVKHGLDYKVEDFGVTFRQRVIDPPQLFTRIFKIDPGTFAEGLQRVWANSGRPANSSTNLQDMWREFIRHAGVTTDTNSMTTNQIFYNDKTGVLMVRASLQDLEVIQTAIEVINIIPPIVQMTGQYVEMSIEAAKALGFNPVDSIRTRVTPAWIDETRLVVNIPTNNNVRVLGADAPPRMRTISEGQRDKLLTDLKAGGYHHASMQAGEQATVDGRQAQVGFATDFETALVADKRHGGRVENWASHMGVIPSFLARPKVYPDGETIRLDWVACLTQVLGHDNSPTSFRNPVMAKDPVPKFRVRYSSSTTLLKIGETLLVEGGLVEKNGDTWVTIKRHLRTTKQKSIPQPRAPLSRAIHLLLPGKPHAVVCYCFEF